MTLHLAFAHFTREAIRDDRALHILGYRTPTRSWARVRWLTTQPAAERTYPTDIHRLQRLHTARRHQRSAAHLLGT